MKGKINGPEPFKLPWWGFKKRREAIKKGLGGSNATMPEKPLLFEQMSGGWELRGDIPQEKPLSILMEQQVEHHEFASLLID